MTTVRWQEQKCQQSGIKVEGARVVRGKEDNYAFMEVIAATRFEQQGRHATTSDGVQSRHSAQRRHNLQPKLRNHEPQ